MKTAAFKSTDIGPIPEDWETKRFDEVYSFAAAGDLQKDFFSPFHDDDHRYAIFSNGLTNMGLYGYTSRPRYKGDSVTITGRGTLGHAEYRKDVFDAIIRLLILTPIEAIDNRFVVYWINLSNPFTNESTSIPQLTVPQVACATLPLPPLPEQRRIAAALSDADELVASLDKLIEKKKRVKEGAMHRLLSGETRLPGFTGKWVEKRLGDFAQMEAGGTPDSSVAAYYGGTIPWVSVSDISGADKYLKHTERCLSENGFKSSSAKWYPDNTLLFAMYASIGKCCLATRRVTSSQAILGIYNLNGVELEFLYYNFLNREAEFVTIGQTGTQSNLSKTIVKDITVLLPPTLAEPRAIAAVLSDMDSEIAALARERAEAERIKQGMMQELLTGKTRLVKGE